MAIHVPPINLSYMKSHLLKTVYNNYDVNIVDLFNCPNCKMGDVLDANRRLWEESRRVIDEQLRVAVVQRKAGKDDAESDKHIALLDRAKEICSEFETEGKLCALPMPDIDYNFEELEDAIRLAYSRVEAPHVLIGLYDQYQNKTTWTAWTGPSRWI